MSAQSGMAMQLGNIQTNSKGGKYLPLRGQGGDPPTWKSEWLKVLWNPSGDPEAVRVSVCLEPDEAAKSFFLEVEDQLAAQLSEHSSRDQRIFGKFLQPEDVKQRMVSALKVSTRGTEFLKLKLHWEKAQLWGPAGERGDPQAAARPAGLALQAARRAPAGLAHDLSVRRAGRDHGRHAAAAGAAQAVLSLLMR